MNKLALTALMVGGLLQASGCIITTDDDDGSGGLLEVTWPTAACNSDTAVVYTLNTATDQMEMDMYPCAAGSTGSSSPLLLPLGTYDVWVQILIADGSRSHATSSSERVTFAVDGDATTVVTDPTVDDMGFFEVSWEIEDEFTMAPLTCTQVIAAGARVVTTLANTTYGEANIFNCDDGRGVSVPMPAGLYTVVMELLNAQDLSYKTSDSFDETIIGNYTINLGIFTYSFDLNNL